MNGTDIRCRVRWRMGRIYVDAVRKQLQVARVLARLIQYENFRLADLVIVNGLPRFLVRLARRASESILHGMVSELLRCGRLAL